VTALPERALWFEDFAPGQSFETRGATLSEAQILDFAMAWDPQPFHLDRAAAEASPYGGLIASGWQTLLVSFRLILATGLFDAASLGSPGVEALRWLKPVRPGDTLRARGEVLETRPSRSKQDRGSAIIAYETLNQRDEVVMDWRCTHLLRRREG
jgi:acyl dehydratase